MAMLPADMCWKVNKATAFIQPWMSYYYLSRNVWLLKEPFVWERRGFSVDCCSTRSWSKTDRLAAVGARPQFLDPSCEAGSVEQVRARLTHRHEPSQLKIFHANWASWSLFQLFRCHWNLRKKIDVRLIAIDLFCQSPRVCCIFPQNSDSQRQKALELWPAHPFFGSILCYGDQSLNFCEQFVHDLLPLWTTPRHTAAKVVQSTVDL